jgi:hypothetical protein
MRTVLALLLFRIPAADDIVFLKNGRRVEGTMTEKGDSCELKNDFVTMTPDKADVDRFVTTFEAIKAEGESMHSKARGLYEEAVKLPEGKAADAKLREWIKILKEIVA